MIDMTIHLKRVSLVFSLVLLLNLENMGYSGDLHSSGDQSQDEQEMMGPSTLWQNSGDCGEMGAWDVSMVMCMPLASPEMSMSMFMVHGNLYGNRVWQESPRGRSSYYSTHMIMLDGGEVFCRHSLLESRGDVHFRAMDCSC